MVVLLLILAPYISLARLRSSLASTVENRVLLLLNLPVKTAGFVPGTVECRDQGVGSKVSHCPVIFPVR